MRSIVTLIVYCVAFGLSAQMISITPSNATGEDEIIVTFDASEGNGELVGASKVYMHSGVIVDGPDGTDWEYVVGNWGADDGIGAMTQVEGESDLWQITLSPTAREYYDVPESETIFRLTAVFRSADGSSKGTTDPGEYDWGFVAGNQDNYIDLDAGFYVSITNPALEDVFLESGSSLNITAEASSAVSAMTLSLDEGQGYNEVASVSSGTTIDYAYTPAASTSLSIRVNATIQDQEVEDVAEVNILLRDATSTAELPAGMLKGINYHDNDDTKATLVLEAPGKEYAYVVGDFNDWIPSDEYLMNQTPAGEMFWYELSDLTPGQEYVFQYWVDGNIRIGDPYADKVADPWNDQYIPAAIYPNPTGYSRTEFEMATILQTAQEPYEWAATEESWERPAKNELIIYELLVRDFLGSHSYQDLTDTLSYLKGLGVNAIELMPIMEFEGNESWGYNPVYYFAPDKYYGTKNDLKHFIETAHAEGFAVILDMVLNHAYGQSPLVKLYWDETLSAPADDSPWFNQQATHPFNVGYDFNHESAYTKAFLDTANHYWLNEYHFDGYRFDLSKGFTQTNSGEDVGAWGAYDASRISLLNRMNNEIKSYAPNAYVILEHFADNQEETQLGNSGMLLWRNVHGDFESALTGNSRNIAGATSSTHVSYMESHDEERQMYGMLNNGAQSGNYDIKNLEVALERAKMGAAFLMAQKGPKMMWQFGELGYDVSINFNSRVGNKPLPWGNDGLGYYEDELRQYVYDAYAAINHLRLEYSEVFNIGTVDASLSGDLKSMAIDYSSLDVVIIGNFGTEEGEVSYEFTHTGDWYDYFGGEEISVTNVVREQSLLPGEFHIYTDSRVSEGFPGVVEAYQTPVTVNPQSFRLDEEITITFDATKASNDGTDGLEGADEVIMYSGVVTDDPKGTELTNVEENGTMTKVSGENDLWEITLTPRAYYGLADDVNAFRIGLYFTDAAGDNVGKGFRGQVIYLAVQSDIAIATFDPGQFYTTQEVSLIFNASLGDQGLLNASKVYAHTGVVLSPGDDPSFGSNVVGNWGVDDGIGQMTKIEGTNKWELQYSPSLKEYYELGENDSVYWVSIVFRNADGSVKGSGPAGDFNGGFIDGNGDIYLEVTPPDQEELLKVNSDELTDIRLFPNPSEGKFYLTESVAAPFHLVAYSLAGQVMATIVVEDITQPVNLSGLPEGHYILQLINADTTRSIRLIIAR